MAGPRTERPNFWSSLSQVDRTELHRIGHVKRFPANSLVLREDDPSDYVLVLRAGCAKVASDSGIGYQTVLALRDPGDLVGEQASVEGARRSASVYALTDVEALVVPASRFTAFRQARPLVELGLAGESGVGGLVIIEEDPDRFPEIMPALDLPCPTGQLIIRVAARTFVLGGTVQPDVHQV